MKIKGYDTDGVKTAVGFLTIFTPKGVSGLTRPEALSSLPFFPVAGVVAGAVSAAVVIVLSPVAESTFARAVIAVAVLAIATRGLHLDAVGDCFDALHHFGNRNKALAVMKDKALGGFGTAGVAFVIAAKIAALGSISAEAFTGALVAIPAASRFGSAAVSYMSEGGSVTDGGLGTLFNNKGDFGILSRTAVLAFAIPLLLCGFGGVVTALLVSILAFSLAMFFKSAFGDANGDVHGTVIEMCEVFGFVVAGALL